MYNTQSFAELNAQIADLYYGRRVKVTPYMYPVSLASAASGGGIVTATQKINGNADFLLVELLARGGSVQPADAIIQITDSASQETLFNTPASFLTVVGDWSQDRNKSIGMSKRLAANSNQVITLQNNGAFSLDAMTIILNGVQIFQY